MVEADLPSYTFSDLSHNAENKFRILALYEKRKETLPTEEICLKTESMKVIQIKKVPLFLNSYIHIIKRAHFS